MPENQKTDDLEAQYVEGRRAVYRELLQVAVRGLGRDAPEWKEGRLLLEREEAIATCRRICAEHGDNDWPDNLHLSDIIEKHLWKGCDGR